MEYCGEAAGGQIVIDKGQNQPMQGKKASEQGSGNYIDKWLVKEE